MRQMGYLKFVGPASLIGPIRPIPSILCVIATDSMRTAPRNGKFAIAEARLTTAQITVLVLTKRQLLGHALAIALQDDPSITVSAAYTDPCAAVAFVRETRPDVVLVYFQL